MKYYIDTEFNEFFTNPLFGKPYHVVDLISVGIVAEDGRAYYAIRQDFDVWRAWNKHDLLAPDREYWLRDNVLMPIFWELSLDENKGSYENWLSRNDYTGDAHLEAFRFLIRKFGKPDKQIAEEIQAFAAGQPEFYAYYGAYDWVAFCSLFGGMMSLPKGFPMYCRDLKQIFDHKMDRLWFLINFANMDNRLRYGHPEHGNHLDIVVKDKEEMISLLKNNADYPRQDQEHNALDDAKWNKELHEYLSKL